MASTRDQGNRDNVFNPVRAEGETFDDYRLRRARAHAINRTLTRGPSQAPAVSKLDVSRFFLGQHTNPLNNSVRAAKTVLALRRRRKGMPTVALPKPISQRKRKVHKHPLRDGHGAYTVVGSEFELIGVTPSDAGIAMHVVQSAVGGEPYARGRRIWLAGLSAQRGY